MSESQRLGDQLQFMFGLAHIIQYSLDCSTKTVYHCRVCIIIMIDTTITTSWVLSSSTLLQLVSKTFTTLVLNSSVEYQPILIIFNLQNPE